MSGQAQSHREVESPAASGATDTHETLIEPSRGWASLRFREIWEYRELLYFLAWRDIKIRYKQTLLGISWAVLQPLLTMLVFALFFGRLARMPSDDVPYPLFAFAALVPWTFFANGLALSSNSLITSGHLITKVYFPRLIVPAATILGGVPDFLLSFLVLLVLMARYGIYAAPGRLIWLPPLVLLAFVTALGAGLWLSALNVKYRDVRYLLSFLTQIWMFATPVVYPASLLSPGARLVYSVNPMVGVVEGFRTCLLGTPAAPALSVVVSASTASILLATGMFYFRRMERTFADLA